MTDLVNIEILVNYLKPFVAAAVILSITLYLTHYGSRLVRTALEQRHLNPEVSLLLSRITYWAILVIGITSALSQLGFDVTSFVASLGIVSIALAFAVQDIAQNFMAGIMLLIQQPFKIGDLVEIDGKIGRVVTIEIRSTTIRTSDGLFIIIPNAQVSGNPITNFSISKKRQVSIAIGVSYDTDLTRATQLMLASVQQISLVQTEPPPEAIFREFGDSAINGELNFWILNSEAANYATAVDMAIKSLKATFDREGIEIPFPTRAIYTLSPKKSDVLKTSDF